MSNIPSKGYNAIKRLNQMRMPPILFILSMFVLFQIFHVASYISTITQVNPSNLRGGQKVSTKDRPTFPSTSSVADLSSIKQQSLINLRGSEISMANRPTFPSTHTVADLSTIKEESLTDFRGDQVSMTDQPTFPSTHSMADLSIIQEQNLTNFRGDQVSMTGQPTSPSIHSVAGNPFAYQGDSSLDQNQKHRLDSIKKAMQHAWNGYANQAFGADEVGPVSGSRYQKVWGDMGVTLVDALDTLYIMDLKDELQRARDWVANHLRFDHLGKNGDAVSIFEVTIRVIGGLISAYDLTHDEIFKTRAVELADLLSPAFDESKGVFYTIYNPHTKKKSMQPWTGNRGILADVGSLQLEMRYLSDITGDLRYRERGDAFYKVIKREGSFQNTGLFPSLFDQESGRFANYNAVITLGAYADSFYEYLLKVWLYSGKKEDRFLRKAYDAAVNGIIENLLRYSKDDDAWYLREMTVPDRRSKDQQDHLACFVPGMLALGTVGEKDLSKVKKHLDVAKQLMSTCYQMYHRQPTGLSPDVVSFPGFQVRNDGYRLRPETVESLMYLFRITKDPLYREWGWEIFEALERHAKTKYGYGAVPRVRARTDVVPVDDKMESFFMAETLKYHFLLQSDPSVVDLETYVFNTEAHPLSRHPATIDTSQE